MTTSLPILLLLSALAALPNFAWGRDEGRSIDLQAYCRKTYGDSAGFLHIRRDAHSWRCILGKREIPVDMDAACKLQYDLSYTAKLENPADSYTWSCRSDTAVAKKDGIARK